jgi:phosphonate transport system substrate-binding protein
MSSAADLKGKKLGIPSPDSITSVLARTTLRDSFKEGPESVSYVSTKYQDAIPFMVEHGLVDAGVTGSDSVAKAWTAAGGKIAFTSKSVPVKLLLAAKHVKPEELTAIQAYFVGLDQSDKGRHTLEAIEKKGFVSFDAEALVAVNRWISGGVK